MALTNIGIFGRRNVGKSSLINLLTGQDTAIVSDTPGTTTDPVRKRMEIPGIGKCNLIDTAGIDDTGDLGEQSHRKAQAMVTHAAARLDARIGDLYRRADAGAVEGCQCIDGDHRSGLHMRDQPTAQLGGLNAG